MAAAMRMILSGSGALLSGVQMVGLRSLGERSRVSELERPWMPLPEMLGPVASSQQPCKVDYTPLFLDKEAGSKRGGVTKATQVARGRAGVELGSQLPGKG